MGAEQPGSSLTGLTPGPLLPALMYLVLPLVTPQNFLGTWSLTVLHCSTLAAHRATLTIVGWISHHSSTGQFDYAPVNASASSAP